MCTFLYPVIDMKVDKIKNMPYIVICMCVALFMTGGFFDHSVACIGLGIVGCLLVMLLTGLEFYTRDKRVIFLIPTGLVCVAVLVSFWAVDYMENFMGVMRLVIVCLWMYLVRSRDEKEVLVAKNMVPLLGCVSIVISLASYFIPGLVPLFWENSRMSGFFQYANTNGLFFAVGIMILIFGMLERKKTLVDWVELFILVAGLLLSGSRSVLLLLLLWGALYALRTKAFRKVFVVGNGSVFALGGVYVLLTGNVENIGRIFTIFSSNSTLWGRLLYYRDAILLLCRKFLGLGRLGYYYSQGTFQSGVYHIRFVHNDFLQVALDYGLIALVLVLLFIGWQIIKGKQNRAEKEILIFICAASLLDFHCQYLLIIMMACLFLDYGECEKEKKAQIKENYVLLPVLCVGLLYIGIATGSSKAGNQELALSMLPDYTNAQEKVLLNNMGAVESYEMATKLIEKNPYNLTAYIVRGSFYSSQGQVEECIADLDKMIELDPYNVSYYEQYELILGNIETAILASGLNSSEALSDLERVRQRKAALPVQLEALEERTSFLAYKIKDVPVFSYE